MMDDRQAWNDWLRVEACLMFGIRRWFWFAIAEILGWKYLDPISTWLSFGFSMLAFGVYVAWLQREDARREAVTS